LIQVSVSNAWMSQFAYDGKMRRRVRQEFTWEGGAWVQTNAVYYVYDGDLVIQERDMNNLPTVTYTRGKDLSGSLEGAGGIGGLLARTSQAYQDAPLAGHSFYHCDGNGNITMLIDSSQGIVAKYLYDAFGNMLSKSGLLADANVYRFSSKEWHANSGLVYYLYRYYDPNLQRWPNRDPIGETGFETLARLPDFLEEDEEPNDYAFIDNCATSDYDPFGLMPPPARKNPHRKPRPSTHDKHTKAQGRPKAGARPGKCKPNMSQNNLLIAPVDQMPIGDLPTLPDMPILPIEDPVFILP